MNSARSVGQVSGGAERYRLPREARAGLMRAWIAILRSRHPDVTWIPVAELRSATERHRRSERTNLAA
jgi:hypothetical protein